MTDIADDYVEPKHSVLDWAMIILFIGLMVGMVGAVRHSTVTGSDQHVVAEAPTAPAAPRVEASDKIETASPIPNPIPQAKEPVEKAKLSPIKPKKIEQPPKRVVLSLASQKRLLQIITGE